MTAIQRPDLLKKKLFIPAIGHPNGKAAFLLLDAPVPYEWHSEEDGHVKVQLKDDSFIVESIDLIFLD